LTFTTVHNKMKKTQNVSHCPNSSKIQQNMIERGKLDTRSTHIHEHSLS